MTAGSRSSARPALPAASVRSKANAAPSKKTRRAQCEGFWQTSGSPEGRPAMSARRSLQPLLSGDLFDLRFSQLLFTGLADLHGIVADANDQLIAD